MYSPSHLIIIFLFLFVVFKEVFANKCNFNVKLTQTLHNEGFHRNITYGLVFDTDGDQWLYQDCILSLDQTLPSGLYVNPDELAELRRSNRINAIPKNRVNIELPAERSELSNVYIISKVVEDNLQMWLPVHARYHQAVSGGGYARNEIKPPKLYLRCPDQRLDVCDKTVSQDVTHLCNGSSREKCSWKEIPYFLLSDTLIWEVPVGNTDHFYVVGFGTTLVIIVGSFYLLKSIHEYNMAVKRKRL